MRISDWSSDVCSSDLVDSLSVHFKAGWTKADGDTSNENFIEFAGPGAFSYDLRSGRPEVSFSNPDPLNPLGIRRSAERRVGQSVSVRVGLGGRRISKKKKVRYNNNRHMKDRSS